jgi:hypothetical protein
VRHAYTVQPFAIALLSVRATDGERSGGVRGTTEDLWDHARNPLTHSTETFTSIGKDCLHDIATLERIVINMVEATVLDWRDEATCSAAYELELDEDNDGGVPE